MLVAEKDEELVIEKEINPARLSMSISAILVLSFLIHTISINVASSEMSHIFALGKLKCFPANSEIA